MWVKGDHERGFYEENVFFINGDGIVCSFKQSDQSMQVLGVIPNHLVMLSFEFSRVFL